MPHHQISLQILCFSAQSGINAVQYVPSVAKRNNCGFPHRPGPGASCSPGLRQRPNWNHSKTCWLSLSTNSNLGASTMNISAGILRRPLASLPLLASALIFVAVALVGDAQAQREPQGVSPQSQKQIQRERTGAQAQ